MPLRLDQIERLKAKFPGLLVSESCSVIDCAFGKDVVLDEQANIYMSTVRDHTYVAARTFVCWCEIGKFCSIGPNSFLGMGGHPTHTFASTHPIFYANVSARNLTWADKNYFDGTARTIVGHDVWIGGNASIKSGVTLGHGAIIGAGAVVTRDVPPYAVVAGVPARKIRDRFTPKQIASLLEYQWWNYDDAWLQSHFRDFHNVDDLIRSLQSDSPPRTDRPVNPAESRLETRERRCLP